MGSWLSSQGYATANVNNAKPSLASEHIVTGPLGNTSNADAQSMLFAGVGFQSVPGGGLTRVPQPAPAPLAPVARTQTQDGFTFSLLGDLGPDAAMPSIRTVTTPSKFDLFAANANIPYLSGAAVATSDFLLSGTNPIAGSAKSLTSLVGLGDIFSRTETTTMESPGDEFVPAKNPPTQRQGDFIFSLLGPVGSNKIVTTETKQVEGGFEIGENIFASRVTAPLIPAMSFKSTGNPITDELEGFEIGIVQGIRNQPLTALENFGIGIGLAAGGEAIAGLGAATEAGTAGTALGLAGRATNVFANEVAPRVLLGLYGADVIGRATTYGTDFGPNASQRLGTIFSTEAGPLLAGGMLYANRGAVGEKFVTGANSVYDIVSEGGNRAMEILAKAPIGQGYGLDDSAAFSSGGIGRKLTVNEKGVVSVSEGAENPLEGYMLAKVGGESTRTFSPLLFEGSLFEGKVNLGFGSAENAVLAPEEPIRNLMLGSDVDVFENLSATGRIQNPAAKESVAAYKSQPSLDDIISGYSGGPSSHTTAFRAGREAEWMDILSKSPVTEVRAEPTKAVTTERESNLPTRSELVEFDKTMDRLPEFNMSGASQATATRVARISTPLKTLDTAIESGLTRQTYAGAEEYTEMESIVPRATSYGKKPVEVSGIDDLIKSIQESEKRSTVKTTTSLQDELNALPTIESWREKAVSYDTMPEQKGENAARAYRFGFDTKNTRIMSPERISAMYSESELSTELSPELTQEIRSTQSQKSTQESKLRMNVFLMPELSTEVSSELSTNLYNRQVQTQSQRQNTELQSILGKESATSLFSELKQERTQSQKRRQDFSLRLDQELIGITTTLSPRITVRLAQQQPSVNRQRQDFLFISGSPQPATSTETAKPKKPKTPLPGAASSLTYLKGQRRTRTGRSPFTEVIPLNWEF